MNLVNYIEEKISEIISFIIFNILLSLFLYILNVNHYLIVLVVSILVIYQVLAWTIHFFKLRKQKEEILNLLNNFDEKYYISSVLDKPHNLVNDAYFECLVSATKAMNDKISGIEKEKEDFEEYVESFCHEIKTPIASLSLFFDNNHNPVMLEEVAKINNLVEQMLYFARSDDTEKDYFVRKINLADVVHELILDNKTYFLSHKISLDVRDLDTYVYTDSKWLYFILSQIIQNSIKYLDKREKLITIDVESYKNQTVLMIKDNGSGISPSDIERVFDKGFTGQDRNNKLSTGMGLYLSKKLALKLGLNLKIESSLGEYTTVSIIFPKSSNTIN